MNTNFKEFKGIMLLIILLVLTFIFTSCASSMGGISPKSIPPGAYPYSITVAPDTYCARAEYIASSYDDDEFCIVLKDYYQSPIDVLLPGARVFTFYSNQISIPKSHITSIQTRQ